MPVPQEAAEPHMQRGDGHLSQLTFENEFLTGRDHATCPWYMLGAFLREDLWHQGSREINAWDEHLASMAGVQGGILGPRLQCGDEGRDGQGSEEEQELPYLLSYITLHHTAPPASRLADRYLYGIHYAKDARSPAALQAAGTAKQLDGETGLLGRGKITADGTSEEPTCACGCAMLAS